MRSCGHLSYLKGKVFWQLWRSVVSEETLAEPFRLPPRDHPASARSDWHGAGAPQHFQLEGKKRRKRRRVRLTGFVASELIASGIGESGSNAKLTRQSALMMTTGFPVLHMCFFLSSSKPYSCPIHYRNDFPPKLAFSLSVPQIPMSRSLSPEPGCTARM